MDEFKDEDDNIDIESILYIGREVSVYKIPPLKANEGHRAQDWGDLAQPLWKGRIRVIERASGVALQFEDPTTGELFAKADYDPAKRCVEAVLDSSRYFVVRVEDSGRKAYIGMGFLERSDSFDFNVALQDYTKRWKARTDPSAATANQPSPHALKQTDYTLKPDETFSINIPGRSKSPSGQGPVNLLGSKPSSTNSGGIPPLLPPPPSAPKRA